MITYQQHDRSSTKVFLDGKIVGTIRRGFNVGREYFYYRPIGGDAGERLPSMDAVKRTIESQSNDR